MQAFELGEYTADLEMAGFFQYITVFSFLRLVARLLRWAEVPNDVRGDRWQERETAFCRVGFQGVALYVVLGMLRSFGAFLAALALTHKDWAQLIQILQEKVLAFIQPVFVTST